MQLLQTLSILIQNIDAGPSVFYLLSNDHINELIRHRFDFAHEEILAQYVSLLKAIALRLDGGKSHLQVSSASRISKSHQQVSSASLISKSHQQVSSYQYTPLPICHMPISPISPAFFLLADTVQFFFTRTTAPLFPRSAAPSAAAASEPSEASLPPRTPATPATPATPSVPVMSPPPAFVVPVAAVPASPPLPNPATPSTPSPASSRATTSRFPLFDAAISMFTHEERMVRTAVRTIILSVCKVPDTAVRQFVSGSSALPEALIGSLRADYAALLTLLSAAHRPEAVAVESTVAPDKTASATAATTASADASKWAHLEQESQSACRSRRKAGATVVTIAHFDTRRRTRSRW